MMCLVPKRLLAYFLLALAGKSPCRLEGMKMDRSRYALRSWCLRLTIAPYAGELHHSNRPVVSNSTFQHKILAVFTTLMLAFVILASKIPTSACHCHEKQSSQKQGECPFKKLRQLSASLSIATSVSSVVPELKPIQAVGVVSSVISQAVPSTFQARAPPELA